MIQQIKKNGGQVTQNGNVIVCHGGAECPMRRSSAPQSAQDEEDFHKLTGIRTGSRRVRELLEQFHDAHSISWRGRGIARMWKHRTLEYDDAHDRLRLNPSLTVLAYGWVCAVFNGVFIVAVCTIVANAPGPVEWEGVATAGMSILGYGVLLYLAVEHMIVPESLARRLRKKVSQEAALRTGGSVSKKPSAIPVARRAKAMAAPRRA